MERSGYSTISMVSHRFIVDLMDSLNDSAKKGKERSGKGRRDISDRSTPESKENRLWDDSQESLVTSQKTNQ